MHTNALTPQTTPPPTRCCLGFTSEEIGGGLKAVQPGPDAGPIFLTTPWAKQAVLQPFKMMEYFGGGGEGTDGPCIPELYTHCVITHITEKQPALSDSPRHPRTRVVEEFFHINKSV